jgi:hypothetical protein
VFALLSSACEPELVVGNLTCPPPDADQALGNPDKVVDAPWSTGFESGFCEYEQAGGICFTDPDASHDIVDAPVHSGRKAAAFTVTADPSKAGRQARCFREGALPREARYGAWFYVPVLADNTGDWNLMHFQGGALGDLHSLWDVSMRRTSDGSQSLYLYQFSNGAVFTPSAAPDVPIGSWFHVEFHFLRAKDATGAIGLYQDGALIYEATGIVTDDTDFGQWYAGNYAHSLPVPQSTLYMDDVTIHVSDLRDHL